MCHPQQKTIFCKGSNQEIDPKAFITITQINEVRGRGFTMEKLRYDEVNENKITKTRLYSYCELEC